MVEFVVPGIAELGYRQYLLSDAETMAYNAPWTSDGTGRILQTDEQLRIWYRRLNNTYYAYIYANNKPVGEVFISPTGGLSIIIEAKYRNQSYGLSALKKLCDLAFTTLGYTVLTDDFPASRVSAEALFQTAGFERISDSRVQLTKERWKQRNDS